MKAKYSVYYESGYHENTGKQILERIQTFKNDREAFAFIHNEHNLRRYGELYLELKDEHGVKKWNERKGTWEA